MRLLFCCLLGDYYIRAFWCDCPIKLFPIIATARPPEPVCDPCEVKPEMVSVTGPGISVAYCHENADFVIDGHEAGPGDCKTDHCHLHCYGDLDIGLKFPVY